MAEIRLILVFDPEDADDDDATDEGVIYRMMTKWLNAEVARMSSAYQGFRIETDWTPDEVEA
jgi:hypothetical protein